MCFEEMEPEVCCSQGWLHVSVLTAGEPNVESRGMFLMLKRLRNTSIPSLCDFSINCFALRTACSASPLDCGYPGLLLMCTKFEMQTGVLCAIVCEKSVGGAMNREMSF